MKDPFTYLLCCYFDENNSTRHLREINPVCNHRNLRLFDAQHRIISRSSALRLVCACVVRVKNVGMGHTRMGLVHVRAFVALAWARVCVQDIARADAKMKCKISYVSLWQL